MVTPARGRRGIVPSLARLDIGGADGPSPATETAGNATHARKPFPLHELPADVVPVVMLARIDNASDALRSARESFLRGNPDTMGPFIHCAYEAAKTMSSICITLKNHVASAVVADRCGEPAWRRLCEAANFLDVGEELDESEESEDGKDASKGFLRQYFADSFSSLMNPWMWWLVNRNTAALELRKASDTDGFLREYFASRFDSLIYQWIRPRVDREVFIMAALTLRQGVLKTIGKEWQNHRPMVLVAVRLSGMELEHASPTLQEDKELVELAVAENGAALRYASDKLREDKDVVKIAVAKNGKALDYALGDMRSDREVVKIAVQHDGMALEYASRELKNDIDLVKIAVAKDGMALAHASENLRRDKGVVMIAVRHDGTALEHASDTLQHDPEVVKIALAENKYALGFVSRDAKKLKLARR